MGHRRHAAAGTQQQIGQQRTFGVVVGGGGGRRLGFISPRLQAKVKARMKSTHLRRGMRSLGALGLALLLG